MVLGNFRGAGFCFGVTSGLKADDAVYVDLVDSVNSVADFETVLRHANVFSRILKLLARGIKRPVSNLGFLETTRACKAFQDNIGPILSF
jgi:hypothetical protein